mmetsp:Transcript_24762/g.34102  ORF Transcript_24762/g.34102 Transcript_24762/m.34102 type:complete len:163 (+) Transcript_24762:515-1003(+)
MRKKMEKDRRWNQPLLHRGEKLDLFDAHLGMLRHQRLTDFVTLLKTVDKLDLNSKWKEIEPLIRDDERFHRVLNPRDREVEFDRYQLDERKHAKRELSRLLKETVTLTCATSGSEYKKNLLLLEKDRRWKRMDCIPFERERIFLDYVKTLPETIPSLAFVNE